MWMRCLILFIVGMFIVPMHTPAQEIPPPGWLTDARKFFGSVGIPLGTTEDMLRHDYYFVVSYNLSEPQRLPSLAFDSEGKRIAQFLPKDAARLQIWSDSVKQFGVGRFVIVLLNYRGKATDSLIPQFSLRVGPKITIEQAILQIRAGQQVPGHIIDRDSMVVDPVKGRGPFRVSYQLNEVANVRHTVVRGIDDEMWSETKADVAKGKRGWEWNRTSKKDGLKAPAGGGYNGRVEAVSVADPKRVGVDGRSFEVID